MESKGCTNTNIQVAVRMRPLISTEEVKKLSAQWGSQNNLIYQIDDSGHRHQLGEVYSFDHIFDTNKTNQDIYNDIVKDFVVSSLSGLNSTIFAYGQTSSGKTFTMLGDKNNMGIMTLAIENIFEMVANNKHRKYLMRVSYMEIYNEKINDLLDPNNKDLKIREFFPSTIGLQNVKEELVTSKNQMYECLKTGNLNRHISATKANDRSSRSHTIFKIVIESTETGDLSGGNGCIQMSSLNLVDLAGSERVAQTKATGMRLKEGGHINKSLSALSLVIKQLSDGQEFVNFRDSKLTRLLQDSLGGNSKTLIIATITLASIEDTNSTLAFAQRAKTIKNKPRVNEILTEADVNKRNAVLNAELQKKLREQLMINENFHKTEEEYFKKIANLQQQVKMLEDFQGGHTTDKSIPKRRHTICFSTQKKLFPRLPFDDFEKSSNDSEDITLFEDLLKRDPPSTARKLSTIEEEESVTINNFSTPENHLRIRLSTLEEEYNELVSFTRHENNIFNETAIKADELEQQLKEAHKKLLEQKNKINYLEEELNSRANNNDIFGSDQATEIIDELIRLQEIIKNANFCDDPPHENSVLRIIEKFNVKAKTSKNIIETEILKQVNNFDNRSPDHINLPNELESFNDLLNELSLFESDIPADVIDNMKKETVEDFKVLIKIYESFLRKNEFIKSCSERLTFLEEHSKVQCKELKTNEKNKRTSEVEENFTLLKEETEDLKQKTVHLRSENTNLKNELSKLKKDFLDDQEIIEKISKNCARLEDEKVKLERLITGSNKEKECLVQEIGRVKLVVDSQNRELHNFTRVMADKENEYMKLKQENEKLEKELSAICENNQCLQQEIQKIKTDKESHYLNNKNQHIEALSVELSEQEIKNSRLRLELENLQRKIEDAVSENAILKEEILKLNNDRDFYCDKVKSLQNDVNSFGTQIQAKNSSLSKLENDCVTLKQEVEKLKQADSEKGKTIHEIRNNYILSKERYEDALKEQQNLLQEIDRLKGVIEGMTNDSKMFTKNNKTISEMEETCTLLKQENNELKQKSDDTANLKNELNKLKKDFLDNQEIIQKINENCAILEHEKLHLEQQITNSNKEKECLLQEIEKVKLVVDSQIREMKQINTEKNQTIREMHNNNRKLTLEIQRFREKFRNLELQNQNLNSEIENIKSYNNKILVETEEKRRHLELEAEFATQKVSEVLLEKKELTNEIEKLKKTVQDHHHVVNTYEQRLKQNEQKVQKYKQLLEVAHTEMDDLKAALSDKDKLKCEISDYRCQLSVSNSKLQEFTKMNQDLTLKLKEMQLKLNDCDKNDTEDDGDNNLRCIKKNLEDVLCGIIEQFINEQKTLMLNRQSQDRRDGFKSVIRDLKSANTVLKSQLQLLRNQKQCDLNEISDNLLKSRCSFHEYVKLEKYFLQKQIDELNSTNEQYLQEIITLKDSSECVDVKDCSQCRQLRMEVAKLSELPTTQEKMLHSLKDKNKMLQKENIDRVKQVVDLQIKMYEEQDRKAEVEYTGWLKFYRENTKMQQKEIETLKQELERYRKAPMEIKKSVEVQCNIIQEESQLQIKYNMIKSICYHRKEENSLLKLEIAQLKNRINTDIPENNSYKENAPEKTCVAVQCDLFTDKYNLVKKLAQMRRSEILELQAELGALKLQTKKERIDSA